MSPRRRWVVARVYGVDFVVGKVEVFVRMVEAWERVVQRWVGIGVDVEEEDDCDDGGIL